MDLQAAEGLNLFSRELRREGNDPVKGRARSPPPGSPPRTRAETQTF